MEQPFSQPEAACTSGPLTIRAAFFSDPGLDPEKRVNEDSCIYRELPIGHLLLVCDGMGGHSGGKQASEAAVQTIENDLRHCSSSVQPAAALQAAIEHAGHVVFELGANFATELRPGSTVVAVLIHTAGSEIAHVGDSRGFLIRAGSIHQITHDHSMVQQMVDAGILSPAQAASHPDANKITRALGMKETVKVELRPNAIAHQPGDVFLLCSDGLTDLVTADEILATTRQAQQTSHPTQALDLACQRLVALANSRGGHDNITVLMAEIVNCSPCVQTQTRTVIDASDLQDELHTTGKTLVISAPNAPVLQPTLIDGSALCGPNVFASDSGATTDLHSAWTQQSASSSAFVTQQANSRLSIIESARHRGTTWIMLGLVLILLAVGLIALSLWWVYSSTAVVSICEPQSIAHHPHRDVHTDQHTKCPIYTGPRAKLLSASFDTIAARRNITPSKQRV